LLPTGVNTTVNTGGSTDLECMQAYPGWVVALQASANGLDVTTMAEILDSAPGQTESCLVLDVYVPVDIFNSGAAAAAPVLFWIHGGGFTYGSKTGSGDPAGLLAESGNSVIVVSINYRLGLFGWLGGPDATPNLGLYDQKLAFEWAQVYISLFGGSADAFTAMGESAGAASVLHQITAYAGAEPAPFQQAIIMSPAFQFNLNLTTGYDLTMAEASSETGETITTTAQLKELTSDQLKTINENVVYEASYGNFNYGPAPDGTFVPDHPQTLLLEGTFDHSIKVSNQFLYQNSQMLQCANGTSVIGTTHIQRICSLH
jgi:carboxylesterase type B